MHCSGRSCLAGGPATGALCTAQCHILPHVRAPARISRACRLRIAAGKGFGTVKPKEAKKAVSEVQVSLEETLRQQKEASRIYNTSSQLHRHIGPISVTDTGTPVDLGLSFVITSTPFT